MEQNTVPAYFASPEQIYRGTDFWMLNDALSDDELVFQLGEMHKQGVASVIARTYIGLKSDYPGEDFMRKTALILKEAEKYGMTVFLQAGYMPEAVLDLPESCALDYLILYDEDELPADARVLSRHNGKVYTAKNSVTLLNLFDKPSVDFYIRQSYDLWQPFSSYFGKTVLSVWVDEPSYHGQYLPWSQNIDEAFFKTYGFDIKPFLYTLYYNEDNYKEIRYQYWTLLQKLMENAYFVGIRDWCRKNGLLFSGHLMMEDSLVFQMKRACAVMPYYKYFDIPGIDELCGRMDFRCDPIRIPDFRKFRESLYNTPKQCVSAAHQAGKEHILCEMYGVTTNGMGFRDFIYWFDHFASLGINHRSVHGIFYSLHGRSKRLYPPQVNYFQPYWPQYHLVTDYCARVSSFLSQGKPVAELLVIHPLETAYLYNEAVTDGTFVLEGSRELKALDLRYNELVRDLSASHIEWELGDINTIESCGRVENGLFVVGEMRYRAVILPYLEVLNGRTASLLSEFLEEGGTVYVVGRLPDRLDGTEQDLSDQLSGSLFFEDNDALGAYLTDGIRRTYSLSCAGGETDLHFYRTVAEDGDHIMVYNENCMEPKNVTLTVRGNVVFTVFDAMSGTAQTMDSSFDGKESRVYFRLPEGGSILIQCEKSDLPKRQCPERTHRQTAMTVGSAFTVSRSDPNVLLLEYGYYRTETMPAFEGPYTALAVNRLLHDADYHGDLVQEYHFTSKKPYVRLSLALEDASQCEVFLNGVKAPAYDGTSYFHARSFEVVRLPDACRTGDNVITVKRVYQPLSKAKSDITSLFECQLGVELECMYLLGDFGVFGYRKHSMNGSVKLAPRMWLDEEPLIVEGDLVETGYPYYCGRLTLSTSFMLEEKPKEGQKLLLSIGDFHACTVDVYVNDRFCGTVCRPPYELPIDEAAVCGENGLQLVVTNTLRPILGPYHNPDGEIGECWGGYGDPDASWTGTTTGDPLWYTRKVDLSHWTDSYNQVRLGVGSLAVIIR